MAVAGQRQLRLEPRFVELLAYLEVKGITGQKTRRRQAVQRRGGRDQDQVGTVVLVALGDTPQGGQTFADQFLMRRKRVVGQGLPVREQSAAHIRRKKGNFLQQALGVACVRSDHGGEPAFGLVAAGKLRQQQGIGGAWRAGQDEPFSGF